MSGGQSSNFHQLHCTFSGSPSQGKHFVGILLGLKERGTYRAWQEIKQTKTLSATKTMMQPVEILLTKTSIKLTVTILIFSNQNS